MELVAILLGVLVMAGLFAWGSAVLWIRGNQALPILAFLAIIGLSAWFWYLAITATGPMIAGMGEALIALALAAGPGAGIVIGVVAALSRPVGIGLAVFYACFLVMLAPS